MATSYDHQPHTTDPTSPAPSLLTIEINYQPKPVQEVNTNWYNYQDIMSSLQNLMYQYDEHHQHVLLESDRQIQDLETDPSNVNVEEGQINVYIMAARSILMKQIEYYERALGAVEGNSRGQEELDDQLGHLLDDDDDDQLLSPTSTTSSRQTSFSRGHTARSQARRRSTNASTRHHSDQVTILHESYNRNQYLTPKERQRLAEATGLTPKQVTAWYTNKRSRDPSRQQRLANGEDVQKYIPAKRSSPRRRGSLASLAEDGGDDDDYEN